MHSSSLLSKSKKKSRQVFCGAFIEKSLIEKDALIDEYLLMFDSKDLEVCSVVNGNFKGSRNRCIKIGNESRSHPNIVLEQKSNDYKITFTWEEEERDEDIDILLVDKSLFEKVLKSKLRVPFLRFQKKQELAIARMFTQTTFF